MKTSEIFKREIGFIKNETMRKIVADTLDAAPDYIQTIPASSSGKYHPKADIVIGKVNADGTVEVGGLVNHVKTVTALAKSMIDTEVFKNMVLGHGTVDEETLNIYADCAIAACILHDCMKADDSPKHTTVFDHPLRAANLFKEIAKKYITDSNMIYMKVTVPTIHGCIASHMGQYNTAPYAKGIVLPKPKTGLEDFVHLCDLIASRKFFDFNFEAFYGK